MALLWPGDVDTRVGEAIVTKSDTATVMSVSEFACSGLETDVCREVTIRLESGEDKGRQASWCSTTAIDPDVAEGDELRVASRTSSRPAPTRCRGASTRSRDFDRRARCCCWC